MMEDFNPCPFCKCRMHYETVPSMAKGYVSGNHSSDCPLWGVNGRVYMSMWDAKKSWNGNL